MAENGPATESAEESDTAASSSEDLILTERGFLFDPATGMTYTLNPTGVFVFQRLRAGMGPKDVVKALTEQFETTAREAETDVRDFCQQLFDFGLVPQRVDANG